MTPRRPFRDGAAHPRRFVHQLLWSDDTSFVCQRRTIDGGGYRAADCLLERGELVTRALCRAPAGDGSTGSAGRKPATIDPAVADRKFVVGVVERRGWIRNRVCRSAIVVRGAPGGRELRSPQDGRHRFLVCAGSFAANGILVRHTAGIPKFTRRCGGHVKGRIAHGGKESAESDVGEWAIGGTSRLLIFAAGNGGLVPAQHSASLQYRSGFSNRALGDLHDESRAGRISRGADEGLLPGSHTTCRANAGGDVARVGVAHPPLGRPGERIGGGGRQRQSAADQLATIANTVDGDYFGTAGAAVAAGRAFNSGDQQTTTAVAMVNEKLARDFWPHSTAIGKRIRMPGEKQWREIVGVAKNANYTHWGEPPQRCVFLPFTQSYSDGMVLYVRSKGDPREILTPIQQAIHSAGPQF